MLKGLSGLAHRPRTKSRRKAVDKWTVRAGARTGSLAVDNALRCPPRGPLPTCPQPSTTTILILRSKTSMAFLWKIQGVVALYVKAAPDMAGEKPLAIAPVLTVEVAFDTVSGIKRLEDRRDISVLS